MTKPVIIGDDLLRETLDALQECLDSHDEEDRRARPAIKRLRRLVKQLGIRRAVALRYTVWGRKQRGRRS